MERRNHEDFSVTFSVLKFLVHRPLMFCSSADSCVRDRLSIMKYIVLLLPSNSSGPPQLGIETIGFQELSMGSLLHDIAILNHQDLDRMDDRRLTVSDE